MGKVSDKDCNKVHDFVADITKIRNTNHESRRRDLRHGFSWFASVTKLTLSQSQYNGIWALPAHSQSLIQVITGPGLTTRSPNQQPRDTCDNKDAVMTWCALNTNNFHTCQCTVWNAIHMVLCTLHHRVGWLHCQTPQYHNVRLCQLPVYSSHPPQMEGYYEPKQKTTLKYYNLQNVLL